MTHKLFTVAVTLLTSVAVFSWLLLKIRKHLQNRNVTAHQRHGRTPELFKKVIEFGSNSHSFTTLYPGFNYYTHIDGVLAFVETSGAWIVGGGPVCTYTDDPISMELAVLRDFAALGKKVGKKIISIPVGKELAEAARSVGFGRMQIGCEPIFDLDRYDPRPERLTTAKQLSNRAAVTQISAREIPLKLRQEADQILKDWIRSKPLPPFEFINQVDPWIHSDHKRYFFCHADDRLVGFLSAIPYLNGQGWYFIDILRAEAAPVGCSEFLILEAMRLLKMEGVREVSLGIAALGDISKNNFEDSTAGLPRLLLWIHDNGDAFFRFKPLYLFKMKFKPTRVEPVFVIYSPNRFGPFDILRLLNAFLPGGILASISVGLLRKLKFENSRKIVVNLLRDGIIVRSAPTTLKRYLFQTKLTLALFVLSTALYLLTADQFGIILNSISHSWSFSLHNFAFHPTRPYWIASAFLHRDPIQYFVNMVSLILFVGTSEILLGTLWTSVLYLGGLLFSNPLLLGLVLLPLQSLLHFHFENTFQLGDVGGSLGIFSCAGALVNIFKRGIFLAIFLATAAIAIAFVEHDAWQFNHLFALGIGYGITRFLLR